MTDKELKKLSRLELLELLLTESRENERLREELERVKKENTVEKSAQQLNETSKQLDSALQKLSSMLTGSAVIADRIDTNGDVTEKTDNAPAESNENEADAAETSAVEAENPENGQAVESSKAKTEQTDTQEQKMNSIYKSVDYNIYKNLMVFFIQNPYSLAVLPDDLCKEITDRIDGIRSRIRQKADK